MNPRFLAVLALIACAAPAPQTGITPNRTTASAPEHGVRLELRGADKREALVTWRARAGMVSISLRVDGEAREFQIVPADRPGVVYDLPLSAKTVSVSVKFEQETEDVTPVLRLGA